jgi:hypothetical protein
MKISDAHTRNFHAKLCKRITREGGDYHVVIFGEHAWEACKDWFPAEKVLNHDRHYIPQGSVVKNNWHREKGRDNFLLTVNKAAAFICGDITPLEFGSSDPKDNYLHVGNNPNKKRTTTRKEGAGRSKEKRKRLASQREEEAERHKAQRKEEAERRKAQREEQAVREEAERQERKEEAERIENITFTITSLTWTDVEHSQFEQGVIAYGWGNWAAMARANFVPTKNRDQLRDHARRFRRCHPSDYQRLIGNPALG